MKYRTNQERLKAYREDPQFFIENMVTNDLGFRDLSMDTSLSETLSLISGRIGERYDTADDVNASIALMNWRTAKTPEEFSRWEKLWNEKVFDVF